MAASRRQGPHQTGSAAVEATRLAPVAWAIMADSRCPSALCSTQGLSSKVQTCRFLVNKDNVGDGVTVCGDEYT